MRPRTWIIALSLGASLSAIFVACQGPGGASGGTGAGSAGTGTYGDFYDAESCKPEGCHVTPAEVSVGATHACVRMKDDTVRCWGKAGDWLGGSSVDTIVPEIEAVRVRAGEEHTCAIVPGGKVKCWGSNVLKQLSKDLDPSASTKSPVPVADLTGKVGYLSVFRHVNCAIMADDNLEAECWGDGTQGATGWQMTSNDALFAQIEMSPIEFALLRIDGTASVCTGNDTSYCSKAVASDIAEVAAAAGKAYLVKRDGTVLEAAKAADDSQPMKPTPLPLSGVLEVRTSQFGYFSPKEDAGELNYGDLGKEAACARLTNGHVVCWGDAAAVFVGQDPDAGAIPITTPAEVPGIDDAIQLSVGARNACVLTAKYEVRCFGRTLDDAPLDPKVPVSFGP